MNRKISILLLMIVLISCSHKVNTASVTTAKISLPGTWRLIKGMVIENGDTSVTDYTKDISFIKIINKSHFAFLQHDLNKGKDSSALFVAGGGHYSLEDSIYTEHLEYCSAREWEGNDFKFTVKIKNDTLIQSGIEKVDSIGVNRLNIETYVKVKS